MPRVICDLPNAGEEISGVKFHLLDDGRRLSDEIGDAAAQRFASIPGYVLDEEDREKAPGAEAPKLTKAQLKAQAKKQAEEAAATQEAADAAAAAVDAKQDGEEEAKSGESEDSNADDQVF